MQNVQAAEKNYGNVQSAGKFTVLTAIRHHVLIAGAGPTVTQDNGGVRAWDFSMLLEIS